MPFCFRLRPYFYASFKSVNELCASFLPVSLSVLLSVCFILVWLFTFISMINLSVIVLSVTSIITILVKLLWMIWGKVTSFVVCQFPCPPAYFSDVWKIWHTIMQAWMGINWHRCETLHVCSQIRSQVRSQKNIVHLIL